MNFASDNVTGIALPILTALAAANHGAAAPYGADEITTRVEHRFADLFEHEVAVFPLATGTAANALALATLTPPWGVVYCHAESHIATDECGAPEFYTGGAKLDQLEGDHGKIAATTILARLSARGNVHRAQPAAISLSQSTEAGTLYAPAEIAAIAEVARRFDLGLHMDGARFANAVASSRCSPAEMTWRAGIDVLSFGATKNGALAAEAVIFFDTEKARQFGFRRKRGGHLLAKQRFVSAQLEAYLAGDLWLANARHANAMAARLAEGLAAVPGARLLHPVEANEIFVALPATVIDALAAAGFGFYRWDGAATLRLVTAFDTNPAHVDALVAAAGGRFAQ